MDGNNWRPTQGQVQISGQVVGGESVAAAAAAGGMEGGDWRSQLQPDSRQRIVNKIMETLKRHLPFSGQEGLHELKKIAVRFEEKIYAGATSQPDYLRKISLKMLTMENKSHNPIARSLQSNPASSIKNPQDSVMSQSMQPQMQNQVQQLPIPSQGRQQVLSQNIPNNIEPTGVPDSSGLTSTLPPVNGMSSVPSHSSNGQNIQSMPSVNPNAVRNSMGQGLSSNIYVNSQQQVQGRQHVGNQDQQLQPQNSQYLYNQQLQHHLKQTFQQGGVPQSVMHSQIQQQQQQQQNLLQPNQIHSSQQDVMQTSLRPTSASSLTLQNQQSTQSRLQQPSLSVLRQQQPQPSIMHQKQTSVVQNQILGTQQSQQQQVSGQQPNTANIQQNQLTGQQHNITDEQQHQQQQQQRIITQQNNISNMQPQQAISQQNNLANMHQQQSAGQPNHIQNMHQQQLGPQTSLSGYQQQQIVGVQHGNSSLTTTTPVHMIQQPKAAVSQQMQPNMVNMLPNQVQQSQLHSMQQQLISHIQTQPGQLQQQLGLQQKGASLQRDMQQRIPTSASLLQQQTTIDQQNQLMQSERTVSELSPNSLSHMGNVSSGDWQEETYQMIKNMNEMYFLELNEIFQRMSAKVQQLSTLPQPKTDQLQLEKLKRFTVMLDHFVRYLQLKKNEIQLSHKEKIGLYHKQIVGILNSNRPRKPAALLQQGQLTQLHTHAAQQSTQQVAQLSQTHMNDGQMNSHLQQINAQGSIVPRQHNTLANLQHNSLSSGSGGFSNSRQNIMDALQTGLNIDPRQGNTFNQMQQGSVSSMQQNSVSSPQMSINSMSSQSGITTLQSNINSLQANQIKQEQLAISTQQIKQQYQHRQMQQQFMQRHQLLPQQQPLTSTKQMTHHSQMNDTNDIKLRNQMGLKPGVLQENGISGQRYPQLKPGISFSTSPQQVLQASSPQIGQHPSPQFDQQNLQTPHSKVGTPLQSANSPYIVPSPSTSLAPSPMPGDNEKINHGVSSLSNAGNAVHHSTTAASVSNHSLAIGTPGISTSPLLSEFISPEGTHGVASTIVSGNCNVVGQPLERLTKVVKSMSSKALSASVSDISSVVNMVDRFSGSAPGNGSRAAVGEDLVAMTKCRLQARNFFTLDGPTGIKRMRRYTHAMPSSVVSSTGSVIDDFWHLNGNESDGESTGASTIKRPRVEATHALGEELKEINRRLIDTVVYISEEDVDPTAIVASTEDGEGTIVKCSFSAVALSPNLKSQYASAQMSPIRPLRLLIPRNYPNSSPIVLDKFPVEVSKEFEDLSGKAKSRFSISLGTLQEPISLMNIARTWDTCARAVISEYFERCGGGSFSSKYGIWENCVTAV